MEYRVPLVAMLACLVLGADCALARSTSTVTTNSYSTSSTAKDIRASCKEFFQRSGGELSAKCNKAGSNGTVSAVSTTLNMPTYANCRANGSAYSVQWGAAETGITTVSPSIVLSSTGTTYLLKASCKDGNGDQWGPSTLDIGDTTNGLKNDAGSLKKR